MDKIYTKALVELVTTGVSEGASIPQTIEVVEGRYPDIRSVLRGAFRPGNLRVGGVNLRPRKYASKAGFEQVAVVSLGPEPYKKLSPFFLGPVTYTEDGKQKVSSNVENQFQFHKLYKEVARKRLTSGVKDKIVTWAWPASQHAVKVAPHTPGSYKHPVLDEWWLPTDNFWKWRETGLHHNFGIRRPNGKEIPIGSLYNGRLIGLVESRVTLYEPAYRQSAYREKTFYLLLKKLRRGDNILILDLDGPKLDVYPSGVECSLGYLEPLESKTVDNLDRYFPYGHGYVLCRMLLELLGE